MAGPNLMCLQARVAHASKVQNRAGKSGSPCCLDIVLNLWVSNINLSTLFLSFIRLSCLFVYFEIKSSHSMSFELGTFASLV